jgi:uncharacterized protein YcaQ
MREIDIATARRIAVGAQGFADPRPAGAITRRHVRKTLDRIGVLQIDSVNVVARAHYLPLFARLGNYPMSLLDEMAWGKHQELIEYWAHMAALIPIRDWPLFRHRMDQEHMWSSIPKFLAKNPNGLEEILDQIRNQGALRPADLDEHHETGRGPWWDWSFAKVALEYLFFKGVLAIPNRVNFTRTYDLTERVLPEAILEEKLPEEAQRRELLRKSMRACGVGTFQDVADYYRQGRTASLPIFRDMVASGEAVEVKVEGWKEKAYLDPQVKVPRRVEGVAFLCPFDPVVWFRPRTERLFEFHYRIEIYTPQPKRVFGYYVFPVLLDGDLVGRLDLKADRASSALLVRGAFVEEGRNPLTIAPRIKPELRTMADWLGLDDVVVEANGALAPALAKA